MAKKNDVYTIEDDRMDLIEYNNWVKVFGKESADKLYEETYGKGGNIDEPLDKELQEIVDNAPAFEEA